MADLKPFEKRMYWLTVIGIAVAFVTGVFIYSQFRAITDQNQILSSQSISAVAGATIGELNTGKQLKIAQDQATAALTQAAAAKESVAAVRKGIIEESSARSKDALDAAIKSSQLDQRAWVGVAGVNTEGGVATHDNFSVKNASLVIHNSGKTPALKIRIECCVLIVRLWTDPIPDYDAEVRIAEERLAARREESHKLLEQTIKQYPERRDKLIARYERFWESYPRTTVHQGGVLAPGVHNTVGIITSAQWDTRDAQKNHKRSTYWGKLGTEIFSPKPLNTPLSFA